MFIGCPTVLRSDYGTENCHIASTQMALRHSHLDQWAGMQSFKYGKSTTNTVCFLTIDLAKCITCTLLRELKDCGPSYAKPKLDGGLISSRYSCTFSLLLLYIYHSYKTLQSVSRVNGLCISAIMIVLLFSLEHGDRRGVESQFIRAQVC